MTRSGIGGRVCVLVFLMLISTPLLMADVIPLNVCNGCGLSGTFATVTLTQNGPNVDVDVAAGSGLGLKTTAGDALIAFNVLGVTLAKSNITDLKADNSWTGLAFDFNSGRNLDGFGQFSYDLESIDGGSLPGNYQSVASYQFKITGVTLVQVEALNSKGYSWGVHFCSSEEPACTGSTWKAVGTTLIPPQVDVPEPATLALFGAGLLALGAAGRKRFRKL